MTVSDFESSYEVILSCNHCRLEYINILLDKSSASVSTFIPTIFLVLKTQFLFAIKPYTIFIFIRR